MLEQCVGVDGYLETCANFDTLVFPGTGKYKVWTKIAVIALTARLEAWTISCSIRASLSSKLLQRTLNKLIQVSSNCWRDVQPSKVIL